jgi:hypothetical protein
VAGLDDILGRFNDVVKGTTDQRMRLQVTQLQDEIKTFASDQDAQQQQLRQTIASDQATLTQLQAAHQALQTHANELQSQVADLQKRLDAEAVVTRSTPVDLVQSFRTLIEQIQSEARGASEVGVTIKSMDVEVKSLVEVDQNQTSLVLPSVKSGIDAGQLSTLRLSFGAVPTVQASSETEPPPPPTPPPPPPPRPIPIPRPTPQPPSPGPSPAAGRSPKRRRRPSS